ncbi:ribonuclease H-like domain-containing protein [Hypoxylon sp. FL0890]|nr:ribonuclease H-like domain-containing protein [Hypoxylon sp. FL0890]
MNFYRSYSLSFHRILYRTRHASRRLGPALSGATPCILYQNGSTVVTVTTARRRHFSAGAWHNGKYSKREMAQWNPPKTWKLARRFKWSSPAVSDDMYAVLESYILDSSRRAADRFPVVPESLDSDNPGHETPPLFPDPDSSRTYNAVVIDCEMVAMKGREQGLLSIAVVDFFTGSIVLRSLVRPTGPVTDWRKGVTGFDKKKLTAAIRKGNVLSGWEEVRKRIFDVTTCETIFIGHALANDLRVLRIATDRVVDSMAMMSRSVFGDAKRFPRNWSLKTACKELLDVEVQESHQPHNPLEDALATRELVLQLVRNPDKLARWGALERLKLEQIAHKERAKETAKMRRKERRAAEQKAKSPEQRRQEAAEKVKAREEKLRVKAERREAERQRIRRARAVRKEKRRKAREQQQQQQREEKSSEEVVK